MDTKQCSTCKKGFSPKRPTQVYCGSECQRSRGKSQPITKYCVREGCDESFEVPTPSFRKKYCSHSCAATVNNSKYPKRALESECNRCSSPCLRGRLYCKSCNDTKADWRSQEKLDQWMSGDLSAVEYKTKVLSKWARNYLIEAAGNKCTECGWCTPNPVTGKPILAVDHIDGNWKNNKFDNLKVLCYNCHTLTPTFGNLNRGSESGARPYAEERKR